MAPDDASCLNLATSDSDLAKSCAKKLQNQCIVRLPPASVVSLAGLICGLRRDELIASPANR